MYNSKLVDNCLKGEVNAEKNRAASCLSERNEARWVFQSNRTRPSEWFKAQSWSWMCRVEKRFVLSRLFHPASARVGVSHCLLCYFVLSLRKVTLKLCFSPAGVMAAVLCGGGLLPVAMVIKALPSRGNAPLLHCSMAVSSLGIAYSSRDIFPCWGAELPLSVSWVIEMCWPYLTRLGIIGWGCLFLAWKGVMAYWNTSLLSCGKAYIPGVVCFFCLSGMVSSHLFPCQSTSTTVDFLVRSIKSCIYHSSLAL